MRTSVVEVGNLLSPLSAHGVEKQLARLPGIERVEVNPAGNSATVVYDKSVINLEAIEAKVRECGAHCRGEMLPKHICESPQAAPSHAHPHAAPAKRPTSASHAEMAHEMGHGDAMDMQAMVRDMRNRFWICLIFSLPIFAYSPMGTEFIALKPPFGLDLNVFLFFSPAVNALMLKRTRLEGIRRPVRRIAPTQVAAEAH